MGRLDNLIFIAIAVLLVICGAMEYRLIERRISAMPMLRLTHQVKENEKLNEMLKSILRPTSITPLPSKDPFEPPDLLKKKGDEGIELKLTTICWSRSRAMAVVNGRIFEEGESDPTGRFTVERIDPDDVIVRLTKGGSKTLKIEGVKGQ